MLDSPVLADDETMQRTVSVNCHFLVLAADLKRKNTALMKNI